MIDETKKKLEPVISPFYQVQKYGANKCETVREKVRDVKTYATTKGCAGEHLVHDGLLQLINVMEFYVDKYLPPVEGEGKSLKDEEKTEVVKRAGLLSNKMKRRLSGVTMKKLGQVKLRSQEAIHKMDYRVDLMEYARKNIDVAQKTATTVRNRARDVWTEETTSEKGVGKQVVNRLTKRLLDTYELTRHVIQRGWEAGVASIDNLVAFASMNRLTISKVGTLTSETTHAGFDAAKIYLQTLKDRLFGTVKWAEIIRNPGPEISSKGKLEKDVDQDEPDTNEANIIRDRAEHGHEE